MGADETVDRMMTTASPLRLASFDPAAFFADRGLDGVGVVEFAQEVVRAAAEAAETTDAPIAVLLPALFVQGVQLGILLGEQTR